MRTTRASPRCCFKSATPKSCSTTPPASPTARKRPASRSNSKRGRRCSMSGTCSRKSCPKDSRPSIASARTCSPTPRNRTNERSRVLHNLYSTRGTPDDSGVPHSSGAARPSPATSHRRKADLRSAHRGILGIEVSASAASRRALRSPNSMTQLYDNWSRLLAEIVTAEGRVDYVRLAERREILDRVMGDFAAVSPDATPAAFAAEEDQLAYWLNAYNAFTLHAIMDEYPITSVWKTRDGQFFQRRRHIAGGLAVSLDDIEHSILRSRFAEPRIHFALNCGSNGCPPIRPSAFQADGLRETLRTATQQFLASEWNCRIAYDTRRIYVSRIFKMYAQDFAGTSGT